MPGLDPHGVPKKLKNTSHHSNMEFEKINKHIKYDLAAIKMEVGRNSLPDEKVLNEVRDLADKKIVLIFDECTSGFRRCAGGLLNNKCNLDINVWKGFRKWLCDNCSNRKI